MNRGVTVHRCSNDIPFFMRENTRKCEFDGVQINTSEFDESDF
ncbi:hypothetical protein DM2_317 [Halorubrum sp. DM2]|nr:hypothetical protein DM2_317 [Halorubrum sp. DM2]